MKFNKKQAGKIAAIAAVTLSVAIIITAASLFGVRSYKFANLTEAIPLSTDDSQVLSLLLKADYSDRNEILQNLPYNISIPALDVGAEAAILVDVTTGNILYEKNADKVIPPASMTKLFSLYVVEEEIEKGNISYDQIIPLPKESWACNMMPHSSLMFLGEGQIVTLEELLLGLSICSGNDAAYALAYTICNSMEEFVQKMNDVAAKYGLEHTHFVESSGYSELNTTTAREMAAFCRIYLKKYPESLERYHSVEEFTYPKEKNLAPGDSLVAQDFSQGLPRHITMPITQKNTNPLLGTMRKLTGEPTAILCDGLKTGYIDESGYNLSLTAHNSTDRFLSVTMGGQGRNTMEGQRGRVHDGTVLMTWGFESFAAYKDFILPKNYFVKAYGTKEMAVNLVPAFDIDGVCVPFVTGNNVLESVKAVSISVDVPDQLSFEDGIIMGQQFGSIKFRIGDAVLDEIPLVADRTVTKAGWPLSFADKFLK